jgi:tRNA 2-thiouridine synthesizing protein A
MSEATSGAAARHRHSPGYRSAHPGYTPHPLTLSTGLLHPPSMTTTTKLDLTGLKCPLPALKTRKALKSVKPGDRLEVHCTDPLSVIDIPHLIQETGDSVEITAQAGHRIVFLIEKAGAASPAVAALQQSNRDS